MKDTYRFLWTGIYVQLNRELILIIILHYRNDGNNVDIEKEMVDSSKNMMRYNALVSALNHNYKMLKTVMKTI